MVEFFSSNPQALEQLRAPLFEDKVVDFILQMASVTEQTVSVEELMRDPGRGRRGRRRRAARPRPR